MRYLLLMIAVLLAASVAALARPDSARADAEGYGFGNSGCETSLAACLRYIISQPYFGGGGGGRLLYM